MRKIFDILNLPLMISIYLLALAIMVTNKSIVDISKIGNMINNFFNVLSPFFTAFFVAYVMNLICDKIKILLMMFKSNFINKHIKAISIFISYFIILLLIIFFINKVLPYIHASISSLASSDNLKNLQIIIDKINSFNIFPKKLLISDFTSIFDAVMKQLTIDNVLNYLKQLAKFSTSLVNFGLATLLSIYYLLDLDQIKKTIHKLFSLLFSQKYLDIIYKYGEIANKSFKTYIGCLIADSLAVLILATIALAIFNIKYSFFIGILLGISNVIPYFGATIAIIFSALLVTFTSGFQKAILVVVLLLIVQQLDANIIQPKIMSTSLSIKPSVVIFAITIGSSYFGMIGILLAIPVVCVLKVILTDILDSLINYKKNKIV